MPIKILERMYNSSPWGLSQVEETKRLGLRGGESGGRLPHRLAMAMALRLPETRSPGPYQWQGTVLVPCACTMGISCPPHQAMPICPWEGEGWGNSPSSMEQNPAGSWSTPTATIRMWGCPLGWGQPHVPTQASSDSWWDSVRGWSSPEPGLFAGGHQGGQLQFNLLSLQSLLLGAPV